MGYMGIVNQMNILDNIGLYRGEFKNFKIDVLDETGVNIPLDTITVKFKICDLQDDEIVYVEKTGESSLVEEGVSDVRLESSDTEELSMSKYQYIIEIQYETGNKSIGKGYLTIL